ncbi:MULTISPECIES: hypothetical protein [Microvirgula]|uniref:Uncharacterized protein n=1 Tax=Microvirgula aerodenitrificans TaxID=57480 RepID=A0A2S0PBT8_9NEIS|nr:MULTISPECIES: hypothetical protein [Microvirgula]AVY94826.1 hypothetical protein DAI18_12835 [Microvirgula aerodenitrificans]
MLDGPESEAVWQAFQVIHFLGPAGHGWVTKVIADEIGVAGRQVFIDAIFCFDILLYRFDGMDLSRHAGRCGQFSIDDIIALEEINHRAVVRYQQVTGIGAGIGEQVKVAVCTAVTAGDFLQEGAGGIGFVQQKGKNAARGRDAMGIAIPAGRQQGGLLVVGQRESLVTVPGKGQGAQVRCRNQAGPVIAERFPAAILVNHDIATGRCRVFRHPERIAALVLQLDIVLPALIQDAIPAAIRQDQYLVAARNLNPGQGQFPAGTEAIIEIAERVEPYRQVKGGALQVIANH